MEAKYLHLEENFLLFVMLTLFIEFRYWDSHTCHLCDLRNVSYCNNIALVIVILLLFSERGEQNRTCSAKSAFISSFFSIKEQFCVYSNHPSLLVSDIQSVTERPKN
jgi:hypothetical protein